MNEKQRRFAEAYAANPNATEAAKAAGYSGRTARSQGQRLLTNADIQKYIKDLQEENAAERIATMTDVKIFWSDTMNDKELKRSDRLKASELLAKSAGAFLHIGKGNEDEVFAYGEIDGSDVVIYMPEIASEESRLSLIYLYRQSEQIEKFSKCDGQCNIFDVPPVAAIGLSIEMMQGKWEYAVMVFIHELTHLKYLGTDERFFPYMDELLKRFNDEMGTRITNDYKESTKEK